MKRFFDSAIVVILSLMIIMTLGITGCKQEAAETTTEQTSATTSEETTAAETDAETTAEETVAKEYTFGYVMYSKNDFWNAYTEKAFNFAAETKGVKVVSLDAEGSQEKSLSSVEDLITQKVDAVDYYPISPELAQTVIQMFNEANIPVVIENMAPVEGPGIPVSVVFVGYDTMGYNVGKWLSENYAGKKVYFIEGQRGMGIVELYMEGFNKAVDEFKTIEITGTQATNWTQDEALSVAQNILQSGQAFDIIVTNNEDMAKGALKAVKEANKFGEVLVMAGGGGGFPDGLELVKNDELIATTSTPASLQGFLAFKALWQTVNGKTPEKVISLPVAVITKDNLDEAAPWDPDMAGIDLIGGLD